MSMIAIVLGLITQVGDPKPQPQPPVMRAYHECGKRSPALGMHCIQYNLTWKEGKTAIAGRTFWRAKITATDGRRITLVAGQWENADGQNNEKSSGIRPPLDTATTHDTNIRICHTPGKEGCHPEEIVVENGFLVVRMEGGGESFGSAIIPWPVIIRNRALAAGASQTTYIVMGVTKDSYATSIHQRIYRPHQMAMDCYLPGICPSCDGAADGGGERSIVFAEHAGGKGTHVEDEQNTRFFDPAALSNARPLSKTLSDEGHRQFVRQACEFMRAAMAVSDEQLGDEVSWKCDGIARQETKRE